MNIITAEQITVGTQVVGPDGTTATAIFVKLTTKVAQITFERESGSVWGGRFPRVTEFTRA